MHTELKMRVNASCRDLVEFFISGTFDYYTIDFLHRSVYDFLRTKDMQHLLVTRAGLDFNPLLALCKMELLLVNARRTLQPLQRPFINE